MDKIIEADLTPFKPLTEALSIPTSTASSSSGRRSEEGSGPGMGRRTNRRSTLTSVDVLLEPTEEAGEL
jgi:hypothetical protein